MDIRILLGQFILGEVTLVKLKQSASSYLNLSFTEKDEIKEVLHAIRCATRQTLAPAGGTYEVPTFIAINLDGSTEPSRIRLSLPVNKDDHTCSWSDITRAILGTLNQTFFKDYPHSLVLVTPHGNMPIQNIDGALACTVNQDPFFTKITSNRCFVIDHVEVVPFRSTHTPSR